MLTDDIKELKDLNEDITTMLNEIQDKVDRMIDITSGLFDDNEDEYDESNEELRNAGDDLVEGLETAFNSCDRIRFAIEDMK